MSRRDAKSEHMAWRVCELEGKSAELSNSKRPGGAWKVEHRRGSPVGDKDKGDCRRTSWQHQQEGQGWGSVRRQASGECLRGMAAWGGWRGASRRGTLAVDALRRRCATGLLLPPYRCRPAPHARTHARTHRLAAAALAASWLSSTPNAPTHSYCPATHTHTPPPLDTEPLSSCSSYRYNSLPLHHLTILYQAIAFTATPTSIALLPTPRTSPPASRSGPLTG